MVMNFRNYFSKITEGLGNVTDFLFTPFPGNNGLATEGRLDFIDGLRGLTMIMVVYWHVLVMSLDITTYTAMTLQLFRMPLFFFVSGFFAYSFHFDRSKLKKRLSNRWHKQMMPTVIIFIAFILFEVSYFSGFSNPAEYLGNLFTSLHTNAVSEFKSGYWFTFVLVEVFCVFAFLNHLLWAKKVRRNMQGLIFLAIAAGCGVFQWLFTTYILPGSGKTLKHIYDLLSLTHLTRYQVFFYLGASAGAFGPVLWRLISRRGVAIMIAAVTLTVFWFTPRFRVPLHWFYAASIMGILFSITLFFHLNRFFAGHMAIGRILKFIGKNTLPIYLLHYFVIRAMKEVSLPWLATGIKAGAWAEIPIVTAISLAIIGIVLGVDALLKIKPRIHRIIFAA